MMKVRTHRHPSPAHTHHTTMGALTKSIPNITCRGGISGKSTGSGGRVQDQGAEYKIRGQSTGSRGRVQDQGAEYKIRGQSTGSGGRVQDQGAKYKIRG